MHSNQYKMYYYCYILVTNKEMIKKEKFTKTKTNLIDNIINNQREREIKKKQIRLKRNNVKRDNDTKKYEE